MRRPARMVAVVAVALVVGATAGAAPARDGAPAQPRVPTPTTTVPSVASDQAPALQAELDGLAEDWAEGGGAEGYPYWESAYRSWRAGRLAGSRLQPYGAAYRSLLVEGSGAVARRDVETAAGEQVRDLLVEALERRIDALEAYDSLLYAQLLGQQEVDGEVLPQVRASAELDLQRSYAATREAMNVAQSTLDQAGQERLPEDAFL